MPAKRQRSAEVEGLDGSRLVARVTGAVDELAMLAGEAQQLFGQVANAKLDIGAQVETSRARGRA